MTVLSGLGSDNARFLELYQLRVVLFMLHANAEPPCAVRSSWSMKMLEARVEGWLN